MDEPYVVLTLTATGMHPETSRLVSVDCLLIDATGTPADSLHLLSRPTDVPFGPANQHGVPAHELADAAPFASHLRTLDAFLDGKPLVLYDIPRTWGFLVAEARRVIKAETRTQSRATRRRRRGRPRVAVGHIPRPTLIVDTLATAMRAGVRFNDIRLGALAMAMGITELPPHKDSEHWTIPTLERASASTRTLAHTYAALARAEAPTVAYVPHALRGDKHGLQRPRARIAADLREPTTANPGHYAGTLKPGMSFVLADDTAADHNELITAGLRAGLTYTENLERDTSLVISDGTFGGLSKALHARRKEIPVLTSEEFEQALRARARRTRRKRHTPQRTPRERLPEPNGERATEHSTRTRRRSPRRRRESGNHQLPQQN